MPFVAGGLRRWQEAKQGEPSRTGHSNTGGYRRAHI